MKKIIMMLTAIGLITFASSTASAQTAEMFQKSDDEYGYKFEDDPLASGGFGPNDAILKVRAKGFRTMLLRPRTSFINELIKSVEDL